MSRYKLKKQLVKTGILVIFMTGTGTNQRMAEIRDQRSKACQSFLDVLIKFDISIRSSHWARFATPSPSNSARPSRRRSARRSTWSDTSQSVGLSQLVSVAPSTTPSTTRSAPPSTTRFATAPSPPTGWTTTPWRTLPVLWTPTELLLLLPVAPCPGRNISRLCSHWSSS